MQLESIQVQSQYQVELTMVDIFKQFPYFLCQIGESKLSQQHFLLN